MVSDRFGPTRDRLHLEIRQTIGIQHDGQRIAFERHGCKYVNLLEAALFHDKRGLLGLRHTLDNSLFITFYAITLIPECIVIGDRVGHRPIVTFARGIEVVLQSKCDFAAR